MVGSRYSARIADTLVLARDAPYGELVRGIMVFTLRAALARAADEHLWAHEDLRRRGLSALQLSKDGKAIWIDAAVFRSERAEARREGLAARFRAQNILARGFLQRLDRDLRARFAAAGYATGPLAKGMKKLFEELERDAGERAAAARQGLIDEILNA